MKSTIGSIVSIFSLFICSLFLMSVQAQEQVIRLSEPVEVTATHEIFGSPMDDSLDAQRLSSVMASPESFLDKTIAIETRVGQVCQVKGCFFVAQDGSHIVRVSFIDYSFFVPTDVSGKTVTLQGELVRFDMSEEQAEHLNSDIGSDTLEAGPVYEIVATSVSVPKA